MLITWHQLLISEILNPLYLLNFRSFCLFQLQQFKSWISNQKIDIYAFEFYHPKINISLAFRALVKNKTRKSWKSLKSTITLEYENAASKTSCNAVQVTSNSKWFSHIANQIASICFMRAFGVSRLKKMNPFLFISVLTLKKLLK